MIENLRRQSLSVHEPVLDNEKLSSTDDIHNDDLSHSQAIQLRMEEKTKELTQYSTWADGKSLYDQMHRLARKLYPRYGDQILQTPII